MADVEPATIEFDFDYLGDILTVFAQHREEIDERYKIKVFNLYFDKKRNMFRAGCEIHKVTEH